ncbi:LOW QUALITY PROTEIN: hypothetical protein PHMEG_0003739 [Phytophthora megakarya]|uniref:MULE transposase domain-containing protein n=1 Tax=Phytophthora megakarya TaxID=4795 RepID=A0A225WX85_9STRA|nr:LOW QUALITY PROTEIN: hypothetical protein PHMEG_0003739 [Phytophthora megakarya]
MLPTKPTKSDIPFWCAELPTLLANFTYLLCSSRHSSKSRTSQTHLHICAGYKTELSAAACGNVHGDTDSAQFNAAATVFGVDCTYTHLMCYYHLLAKVVERTKGLSKEHIAAGLRDVYDMHCARDAQFSTLSGRRLNSCFHSPPGYATTNNPVEQFNRVLKRDHTVHRFSSDLAARQYSIDVRQFAVTPTPSKELLSRVKMFQHQ